jgi:hypothetical protein
MRLADVDDEERRGFLVFRVQRVQGGNLPPERRSRVAAEYENNGLSAQR